MYVAIETEQLAKHHAGHGALREVTLHVEEGEIFAFLAGAREGKTSLVRILTGRLLPTAGRARVAGIDVVEGSREVRARTGVTLKEAALDGMLTGRQYLEIVGALWALPRRAAHDRAEELLGLLELAEVAELRLSVYPAAARRRLDVAASLVRAPEVLFLDEPSAGLARPSRNALWDEIRRLRAGGTTVFLTTRHAEEAQAVADRVGRPWGRQGEDLGEEEPGEAA